MEILVTCNIATSLSLPSCRDGVRSYTPVIFCLSVAPAVIVSTRVEGAETGLFPD